MISISFYDAMPSYFFYELAFWKYHCSNGSKRIDYHLVFYVILMIFLNKKLMGRNIRISIFLFFPNEILLIDISQFNFDEVKRKDSID